MASATSRFTTPADVARRYFEAINAHDLDAMAACWAPGGVDRLVGSQDVTVPDGMREFFRAMFDAIPDLRMEVLELTSEDDRCAVQWRQTGTFAGPGRFQGFEPNGARIDIGGCDVVQVHEGLIRHNDAYVDTAAIARQLGALPPRDSVAEQRLAALANARGRLAGRVLGSSPEREPVADGVWLIRGGFPFRPMNVYLIEDEGGVTLFDAGAKSMAGVLATAGAQMGGIRRIVLSHAHPDHRGGAPALRVPVYIHADDADDARTDGGLHYFEPAKLGPHGRLALPRLLRHWDGGPVEIAGTVAEGDELAGFRVIHLPGHAPGQIALWRESDRLALTGDVFDTLDPQTGIKGRPRVPPDAFNHDTAKARESILRLAALEPAAAWPGHADALTGDVRAQLERAAGAA